MMTKDTTVDWWECDVRTINVMKASYGKDFTILQLLQLSDRKLLDTYGVGRKTFYRIKDLFYESSIALTPKEKKLVHADWKSDVYIHCVNE